MLYPDFEKRKQEFERLAELFYTKGYPKTAKEVQSFIEILKLDQVPTNFLKRLDSLFDLFGTEFVAGFPIGQKYRKVCYEQTKVLVFGAIGRLKMPYFSKSIHSIYPLLQKVNRAKATYGFIAEELRRKTPINENVVFHLYCYSYLIFVEGIFDELARILYFFAVVSQSNIPKAEDLEKLTVNHVVEKYKTKLVVFQKWDEKRHIRNSIGHALTQYDSSNKTVRFEDYDPKTGKTTYDSGFIPFAKFIEMALELEDSLMAFSYIILLLKTYDFVVSTNPFA